MNGNIDFDELLASDTAANSTYDRVLLISELARWRPRLGCLSILAATPALAAGGAGSISLPNGANASDDSAIPGVGRRSQQRGKFFSRRDNYLLPQQEQKPTLLSPFAGGDNCPGAQIPSGIYTPSAPYADTGDTTGANNTINSVYCYYCVYLNLASNGPDHVYTFAITSTGANPEIRVTPSSGSYDPLVYILAEDFSGPCPSTPVAGTVGVYSVASRGTAGAGEPEIFGANEVRFLPRNIRLHLVIDSVSSTANPAGAYTLRMQDVSIVEGPRRKFDFDRDGDSDISVFRPSSGKWYTSRGSLDAPVQFAATQFGIASDQIVPADYDNDGRTDIAVFREGTWYWINSSNSSMQAAQFGLPGDVPQPADFDGDGRSELVVFRAGTWYTYNLRTGEFVAQPFGIAADKPLVGDYDGDGRADYAVYRNGTWFLLRSLGGFIAVPFGLPNDIPVPANYVRNPGAQIAVFRNGTWHVLFGLVPSPGGQRQFPFGQAGDIPVPGDYDGRGFAQLAVVRDGVWYVGDQFDGRVVASQPFGLAGDQPVPAAYLQR